MHHGADVAPAAVDHHMHVDFTGNIACAADLVSALVDDYQVLWLQQSFAHQRGRAKNVAVLQAHRQVAIGRRHQPCLVKQLAEADNLFPVLLLRLHAPSPASSIRNRCCIVPQVVLAAKGKMNTFV